MSLLGGSRFVLPQKNDFCFSLFIFIDFIQILAFVIRVFVVFCIIHCHHSLCGHTFEALLFYAILGIVSLLVLMRNYRGISLLNVAYKRSTPPFCVKDLNSSYKPSPQSELETKHQSNSSFIQRPIARKDAFKTNQLRRLRSHGMD